MNKPASDLWRWRLATLLICGFALFGSVGDRLLRPSRHNHFSILARDWLRGDWKHDAPPPGFCPPTDRRAGKCKAHNYDDWGRIYNLPTAEGEIQAIICRTHACEQSRKADPEQEFFVTLPGHPIAIARDVTRKATSTWFISFPPGPALLFLPWVAAFGTDAPDRLANVLAAILLAGLLFPLLSAVRPEQAQERPWLVAALSLAFILGSPIFELAANANVWFTGQVFATTALAATLLALARRHFLVASTCAGMAFLCRPTMLPGLVVLLAATTWQTRSLLRAGAWQAIVPLTLILAGCAFYNYLRFDNILEFGHRYLDIRWQARIQEHGMFSLHYLPRNLLALLALLPRLDPHTIFKVSVHGSALWLTSSWLLAFARRPQTSDASPEVLPTYAVVAALLLTMLFPLLYQNTGQVQFSYRFAADWLLYLLIFAWRRCHVRPVLLAVTLAVSIAVHAYASWNFERAPGRIFFAESPGSAFDQ